MRVLIFLNIFFLILIRILIKRNKFIKWVAYFSIFFQSIIILTIPFRERLSNVSLNNLNYLLIVIFFICLVPVLIPLLLNFLLSSKRKKLIKDLENKINQFCYSLIFDLQNFFLKNSFYEKIETFVSKNLTLFVLKVIFLDKDLLFFFFLGIPWSIFLITFYFELFQGNLKNSFYFLAYFMVSSRILSGILFLVKNTAWNLFNQLLLKVDTSLYFSTVSFADMFFIDRNFLAGLLFNQKANKNREIVLWQKINELLYFFVHYAIVKNYWKNLVSRYSYFFFCLNFFLVTLGLTFYFFPIVGFFYLIILPFLLVKIKLSIFSVESLWENNLNLFLTDLDGFIGTYQQKLVNEKAFSNFEASQLLEEDIPKNPQNSWIVKTVFVLFGLLVYFFFFLVTLEEICFYFEVSHIPLHQEVGYLFFLLKKIF